MVRLDITFMSSMKAEHREWPFLSPRMAFLKMSKVILAPAFLCSLMGIKVINIYEFIKDISIGYTCKKSQIL